MSLAIAFIIAVVAAVISAYAVDRLIKSEAEVAPQVLAHIAGTLWGMTAFFAPAPASLGHLGWGVIWVASFNAALLAAHLGACLFLHLREEAAYRAWRRQHQKNAQANW